MAKMKMKIWGSRGSIPSPSRDFDNFSTAKYGGNTSCYELIGPENDEHIIDLGSGIVPLGDNLMGRGFAPDGSGFAKGKINLYQTHLHHDHIQGLGFATPLFIPGNKVQFFTGYKNKNIEEELRKEYSRPRFPIGLDEMPANKTFKVLEQGRQYEIGDLLIEIIESNHPDPCYGFKFTREDSRGREHSYVHLVDNEHDPESTPSRLTKLDQKIVKFMKGADVVTMDSPYTPQQYDGRDGPVRQNWGHSTYEMNLVRAAEANVSLVILAHHDPRSDDDRIDSYMSLAKQYAIRLGANQNWVVGAKEGDIYEI